ncbi:hypothetical protein [Cohnella faecalis]|uniref:Uncharacterized protein n=1 Tax=Cohnella faecalis TaxID=2315694 RepID=A0A398CZJ9_9BACL|nr:hypothetical protein [Cohnella faecalis]RIE05287.1 hypothetical protein D3H35_01850 [Cohnella faecalis]
MLFDKQTGDAPSPAGPKISFALSFSHNAKPALYGDNQSAFSVQLTKEGVIALREALQGEMSPIGIIYSLDYLALRPAYSVRLSIDWERVQNHLDETFGSDSIFINPKLRKPSIN